jgi:tetratricopeptide (TPR) repeat protein
LDAAIASYRKINRIEQALRLTLNFPDIPAARKLIRQYPDKAITYFRSIYNIDSRHANASFALTVALAELGRTEEARQYAEVALNLTRDERRRKLLAELTN